MPANRPLGSPLHTAPSGLVTEWLVLIVYGLMLNVYFALQLLFSLV